MLVLNIHTKCNRYYFVLLNSQRPEDLTAISEGLLSPFKSQVHEAKKKVGPKPSGVYGYECEHLVQVHQVDLSSGIKVRGRGAASGANIEKY